MNVSAKEAAALVGISKQGIIRAIHKGKLSATRNDSGEFVIETSELFRVYQPATTTVTSEMKVVDSVTDSQSEVYRVKIDMLEQRLRDKDEYIADLSTKLDAAMAGWQKSNLLLEDKQQPRNWWQRLLGK